MSEVEKNWNFNNYFPTSQDIQIHRPLILSTIRDVLTGESPVVFLEGEAGIGLTTTLAQFVEENPEQCFSIFLNPASRYSYSADYVKLKIAEQLKIYIDGVPLDRSAIDDSEYTSLIHKVRSRLKGKQAYFVVDGLDHIPREDDREISNILTKALPIGIDCFRFLLSGGQKRLSLLMGKVASKPFQLMKLSNDEAAQLFVEFSLDPDSIEELLQICVGNPGRLSTVRRLIKSGIAIEEILREKPEKYLDFIAYEFKALDHYSSEETKALAVIVFSKQAISSAEIEKISGIDENHISSLVKKATFVEQRENGFIDFLSNSHRKYAEKALKHLQSEIADLQISYLRQDPNSSTALLFLASYLQERNKNEELIDLISNEHYYSLLGSTQSLNQLMLRAELGLTSARALNKATSVFQFSLHKSLFIDLQDVSASKSEIDTLIALGQSKNALALVDLTITKISKLSLLVAYAKGLKKKGKAVEKGVIELIKNLVKDVDFSTAGRTALQIAEDLIFIDPDLASDTLEKSLANVSDPAQKDFAYSKLSLVASAGKAAFIANPVESKIKSKAVQEFTEALTLFYKEKTSNQIISFIESSTSKNKIRLLISVIFSQPNRPELLKLIEFALDSIVKDSNFIPKAKDYADLALVLRHQNLEKELLPDLVKRFDVQIGLVRDASVTRDWIRLNVNLAYAEARYNNHSALMRLLDCYYEISSSHNIEVKTECFARLLYAVKELDEDGSFESKEGLKDIIGGELNSSIEDLINNTAMQHECLKSVIPAVIEHDEEAALDIADKFNNGHNRDLAYQQIIELIVKHPPTENKLKVFTKALNRISEYFVLEESLLAACDSIQKSPNSAWCARLSQDIGRIKDKGVYLECKTRLYKTYENLEDYQASDFLTKPIDDFLNLYSSGSIRNDICFEACEALATRYPEEAEAIYHRTTEARSTFEYENPNVQQNFLQCLSLVIRAFGAAFQNRLVNDALIERLANAVGQLTSVRQQISLFNELACRAWIAEAPHNDIVDTYCRPIIEQTKRTNPSLYKLLVETAFPSLFISQSTSSLKMLDELSPNAKHSALFNTAEFIRRKLTRYDPKIPDDSDIFLISYRDALNIVQLLEAMDYDAAIYFTLEKLCRSLASKKNKNKMTVLQRKELSEQLLDFVTRSLPDKKNISHEGYLICCKARIYMLTEVTLSKWEQLIVDAKKIENVADKAYVLIEISSSIPTKHIELRRSVLKDAEAFSEKIPALKDRLGRLELYSLACKDSNIASAKDAIKRSFKMAQQLESADELAEVQKSIIDAADQIEPGFADILFDLFDDDPGRGFAKDHVQQNLELIKAKKSLANCTSASQIEKIDENFLSEASWKNLASLLANRINTKELSVMAGYMTSSMTLGLGEVYPLFCWYIENASRKYKSIDDANTHLMPLCEMLLTCTELALSVVSRKGQLNRSLNVAITDEKASHIINPSSRDAAMLYIREWLSNHCGDHIKICDPYFSKDDLEIIKNIQEINPDCEIHVVASAEYLNKTESDSNEEFEKSWIKISDQLPPIAYIYGVGKLASKDLIHDRWLLSDRAGLRIGTSFNSIGNKYSEISQITEVDMPNCVATVDTFLQERVIVDGQRVKTTRYTL